MNSENDDEIVKDLLMSVDLLILVYEDIAELSTLLCSSSGVMAYTAQYWAGFFPLLLVNISHKQSSIPEGNTDQIFTQFCSVHHLVLQDWQGQADVILETMVKFLVHLEKCWKGEKKEVRNERLADGWKCPNQCGLENLSNSKAQELRKKRNFFQVVKKNLIRNCGC